MDNKQNKPGIIGYVSWRKLSGGRGELGSLSFKQGQGGGKFHDRVMALQRLKACEGAMCL